MGILEFEIPRGSLRNCAVSCSYDCNVTVTDFRMPLSGAMQLMKHTDLLLGMHGAGKHTLG